jgi:hypothetical protein
VGVDLATKHDRSVVAVCHAEPVTTYLRAPSATTDDPTETTVGCRVVVDRLAVWAGTRAEPLALSVVENYVAEVSDHYQRPPVLFDPFQAVGMMQRLQGRGVYAREFTFSAQSVGRLGQTLHSLIRSHQLALPDDAELLDELANVRLRETAPGVVRLDHDHGRHDDRAVAIALAAHHLLGTPVVGNVVVGAPSTWDESVPSWERLAEQWAPRGSDHSDRFRRDAAGRLYVDVSPAERSILNEPF